MIGTNIREEAMAGEMKNLEEVSQFKLDRAAIERIYAEQNECTVCWTTKDGWPVGMTHLYVWANGSLWVMVSGQRKRVLALRKRPKSCLVITSKGTSYGAGAMVAVKTTATIHEDRETLRWFLPLFMARTSAAKDTFDEELFVSERRVVIEFKPVEVLSFDPVKLQAAMAASGVLRGEGASAH
jgi:hypothetical protein